MWVMNKIEGSKSRVSRTRLAVAGAVGIAVAAMAVAMVKTPRTTSSPVQGFAFKRGSADLQPGGNKKALFGASEFRWADYTPAVEAYLMRAYPGNEVPWEATLAAKSGWESLNAKAHSKGTWELIGPSEANVPGVLNALGDAAPYITAGRVTALALSPKCGDDGDDDHGHGRGDDRGHGRGDDDHGKCRLYVAAAGGGIWRTDKPLHTNPSQKWEYISGSFGTNAIGSLIIDPTDPSGETLYAGTGEPNVSADSEAGVGIYKTTNGGDTWTHLASTVTALTTVGNGTYTGDAFAGRSIGSIVVDPRNPQVIYVASARGVRGVASTGGGTSNPPTPRPPFGLFKSTNGGATFTFIWDGNASNRGVIHAALDPSNPDIVYASALNQGTWRSMDGGTTFTVLKARLSANDPDRPEFAVTKLPNGKTRMYLGEGVAGTPPARFFRTDDASGAAPVFTDLTTAQNINYCTGQCWYDNTVYSPAGFPDIVYLLGSFDYSQIGGASNGRGVLLSTDAGATWSDLTQDGDATQAEFTHPDQHAIVTLPGKPFVYWEGSDGGIVSSDGRFSDVSAKCDTRGLNAANLALCKSLLSRVPHQLANNINKGFSTLQFQSLSVSQQHPRNILQGGTQDNGTWQNSRRTSSWNQIIYGDGGQSGFSSTDEALRFNTFTGQAHDANFRNGDPTKWVIISAPIITSPEASLFYPPIIADPNPSSGGTIFQGSFSVWRTQDWGGNQAFLEANCPEFTTSAAQPGCGDFVRIGGAPTSDLTSTVWGNRAGNALSALRRRATNTGTLWAATGTGRVFISDNADAAAASVVWNRVDPNPVATANPNRFVTGIAVDPANAHRAWISYSGYNFNTPAQPGHVIEVTWSGAGAATFVDVSHDLPDLPITDVAYDEMTGDLYASSDFGVMRLPAGSSTWTVAGSGLPMVEVSGLTIVPEQRILYAATHGRSAWSLKLP